jgi:predicted nuclease with TOPRIM domain
MGEDIAFFNTLRDKIRETIKEKLTQLEATNLEEERQPLEAEIDRLTERLMNLGLKITNINDKLPTAFNTVEDLKQKLLKEKLGGAGLYGGGELNNREK